VKVRWLLMVLLLVPAVAAGYITVVTWQGDDDSKWVFGVFTVFFLSLALIPLVPPSKRPKSRPETLNTRFVPHWFLEGAIVVVVVVVLASLLRAIFAR